MIRYRLNVTIDAHQKFMKWYCLTHIWYETKESAFIIDGAKFSLFVIFIYFRTVSNMIAGFQSLSCRKSMGDLFIGRVDRKWNASWKSCFIISALKQCCTSLWPCVLNSPPKKGGDVTLFHVSFHSFCDISAKQKGIVVYYGSFAS